MIGNYFSEITMNFINTYQSLNKNELYLNPAIKIINYLSTETKTKKILIEQSCLFKSATFRKFSLFKL